MACVNAWEMAKEAASWLTRLPHSASKKAKLLDSAVDDLHVKVSQLDSFREGRVSSKSPAYMQKLVELVPQALCPNSVFGMKVDLTRSKSRFMNCHAREKYQCRADIPEHVRNLGEFDELYRLKDFLGDNHAWAVSFNL